MHKKLDLSVKCSLSSMLSDFERSDKLAPLKTINENINFKNCNNKDYLSPHKIKRNKQRIYRK